MNLSETEFNSLVDETLLKIETALERSEAELDFESASGILQISFDDGSKIIVNRQTPNREIWVAARAGGFHFRLENGDWRGTRDGRELFAVLSECASQQAREAVDLTPLA
jgi:CyaY protein